MTLPTPSLLDLDTYWVRAAHYLGVRPDTMTPHPGSGGHVRSGPVTTGEGVPAWLRIWLAPQAEGGVWEGPSLAAHLFDERVPRPILFVEAAWTGDDATPVAREWAVQIHLYERLPSPPLSPTPVLTDPIDPPREWWDELTEATAALRDLPPHPERWIITQDGIDRAPRVLPELEGEDLTVERWETAHGDLHWANLTAPSLRIIDWEGWGTAPAGYDAAVLHTYALPVPEVARRVREEFAESLDGRDGRLAQIVVAAEVIHSAAHDDLHAALEPFVRDWLKRLL
ncbi:phosphotransferase [Nocardiopsis sp. N85]|uniref:phosphotransferase n=1 Tax=Nocardiopsis sp. N85 TaxID=3029400 RepID=UPI00237F9939|nr:phosphotransferase [Nocardiopsis sp. N85]MDE3721231.1 phosphotransferase [Nocardiopsis sp. N85]